MQRPRIFREQDPCLDGRMAHNVVSCCLQSSGLEYMLFPALISETVVSEQRYSPVSSPLQIVICGMRAILAQPLLP